MDRKDNPELWLCMELEVALNMMNRAKAALKRQCAEGGNWPVGKITEFSDLINEVGWAAQLAEEKEKALAYVREHGKEPE